MKISVQSRSTLRAVAQLADDGLDGSLGMREIATSANIEAEYAQGDAFGPCPVTPWCGVTRKQYKWADRCTVDCGHLGQLLKDTVREAGFEKNIPHQFFRGRKKGIVVCSPAGKERLLAPAMKFIGWIKAAGTLPAVRKVIRQGLSSRGIGSPKTKFDFGQIFVKFPSPGRLERRLWAVRKRSDEILSAYAGGKKPAWWVIAHALSVTATVGKAAVIAVATTISGHRFRGYARAREWLVNLHLCSVAEPLLHGVVARRNPVPIFEKLGTQVFVLAV